MAAGVGQKIESGDYSTIKQKVDLVLGVGSGQSGYGQTTTSPTVSTGNTISAADWIALRNDIAKVYQHQTGGTLGGVAETSTSYSGSNLVSPQSGVTVISEAIRGQFNYMADRITTNKFNAGSGQLADTTLVSGTSNQPWNNVLTQTVTVTFASSNAARYFFNAGGKIRASANTNGGTSTTKDQSWTTLLAGIGEVAIDYSNFYGLTTNDSQIVKTNSSVGAYTSNYYKLSARVDNASTPSVLTLTINFADDAFGPPDDNVDATITSTVKASTPTGAFTLTAPTATQSGFTGGTPSSSNYSISPDKTNMNEGDTVIFTITGSNIPNATVLYWTLDSSSTFPLNSYQRFSDSQTSGTVTINNNTATLTRQVYANTHTDASSSFSVNLRSVSVSGTILATSSQITVNDTSLSAPTSFIVTFGTDANNPVYTATGNYQAGPSAVTVKLNNPATTSTSVTVPWSTTIPGISPSTGNYTFNFSQGTQTAQGTGGPNFASATSAASPNNTFTITPGTNGGLTTTTGTLTYTMSAAASIVLSGYAPNIFNNADVASATATTLTQKYSGSTIGWIFNSTGGSVTVSSITFPTGVTVNGYILGSGSFIPASSIPSFTVSGTTIFTVGINLSTGNSASGNITVSFSGATSPTSPQTTAMTITRIPVSAYVSFSPNTSGPYKDNSRAIINATLDVPTSSVSGAITVSVPYTGTGSLSSISGSPITLTFPDTGSTTQSSSAISTAGASSNAAGTIVIGTPTSSKLITVAVSQGLGTYSMDAQGQASMGTPSTTPSSTVYLGQPNIAVNWTSSGGATYVVATVRSFANAQDTTGTVTFTSPGTSWPASNASGSSYTITAPTSGKTATISMVAYLNGGVGASSTATASLTLVAPVLSAGSISKASVPVGTSTSFSWTVTDNGPTAQPVIIKVGGVQKASVTNSGGYVYTPTSTSDGGTVTAVTQNEYGVTSNVLTLGTLTVTAGVTVSVSGGGTSWSYSSAPGVTGEPSTNPALTFTGSGGTGAGWGYTASGLPSGLSIGSSTGTITGTPSVVSTSPSSYSFTVTATDNANNSGTFSGTISVTSPIAVASIAVNLLSGKQHVSLSITSPGGLSAYNVTLTLAGTGCVWDSPNSGTTLTANGVSAFPTTTTGDVAIGNSAGTVYATVSRTGFRTLTTSTTTVPSNIVTPVNPTLKWLDANSSTINSASITVRWGYSLGFQIANGPGGSSTFSFTATFSNDTINQNNGTNSVPTAALTNGTYTATPATNFFADTPTTGRPGRSITYTGTINSFAPASGYSVSAIPGPITAIAYSLPNTPVVTVYKEDGVTPVGTPVLGDKLFIKVSNISDTSQIVIKNVANNTTLSTQTVPSVGQGTVTYTHTTDTTSIGYKAYATPLYSYPSETIGSNTVTVNPVNIAYQFNTSYPYGPNGAITNPKTGDTYTGPFYPGEIVNLSIVGLPNEQVTITSPNGTDTRYGGGITFNLSSIGTDFDVLGAHTGGYLGACTQSGTYSYRITFASGKQMNMSYNVSIPALTVSAVTAGSFTRKTDNVVTFHSSTVRTGTSGQYPISTALTNIGAGVNGAPSNPTYGGSIQNIRNATTGIPENNHYFYVDATNLTGTSYTGTITLTDSYGQTSSGGTFSFTLPDLPPPGKPTFESYGLTGGATVGSNFAASIIILGANHVVTTANANGGTTANDGGTYVSISNSFVGTEETETIQGTSLAAGAGHTGHVTVRAYSDWPTGNVYAEFIFTVPNVGQTITAPPPAPSSITITGVSVTGIDSGSNSYNYHPNYYIYSGIPAIGMYLANDRSQNVTFTFRTSGQSGSVHVLAWSYTFGDPPDQSQWRDYGQVQALTYWGWVGSTNGWNGGAADSILGVFKYTDGNGSVSYSEQWTVSSISSNDIWNALWNNQ
jgi:hypothetical protein